jgi:hypothetical protein
MIRHLCLAASALGLLAVIGAAPANADDDAASDQAFSRLLSSYSQLFNFDLEKSQGQQYCKHVIDGEAYMDATHELMRTGSYTFDVANVISSAADQTYCYCAREGIPVLPGGICRPFELAYVRHE